MNAPRLRLLLVVVLGLLAGTLAIPSAARATGHAPVSGAGSTWAQNGMAQWIRNVNQLGLSVNYLGTGSEDGRNQFRNGTTDFAVSEIPYGLTDAGVTDPVPTRPLGYVPLVAGGLGIGFNLRVGGQQLQNLRLSGKTLAKIFTGQITRWDDPLIRADNSGLRLPGTPITPVVRSDASGTTYVFTSFLAERYPADWAAYMVQAGRSSGAPTSNYPVVNGSSFVTQSGSLGVSGYVSQAANDGTITYVENSYLRNTRLPSADLRNVAGYYVGPDGLAPAIALTKATVGDDGIANLSGAINNPDPRSYPLSYYAYGIIPTGANSGSFTSGKRQTLAEFLAYSVCEGSQQAAELGYTPLPLNLVRKTFDGLAAMKAADPTLDLTDVDLAHCANPIFDKDDLTADVLGATAPMPAACQKAGAGPCGTGLTSLQYLSDTPVLTGTPRIGRTVRVPRGRWLNAGSFRYVWRAGTTVVGRTSTPSFKVPARAGGKRLGATVIATSVSGTQSMAVKSNTHWIRRGTQRISSVAISGRPLVGTKLTALVICSPRAVRHYRWYADGRPISGATRATWILKPAQRGKRITVKLTLTRTGYFTVSRTSARTSVVGNG